MDVSQIEVIEFLRDIYPFRKLDENLIEFAAGNFEPRQYQAGDVIFRQDEPARFLYILMDGAVNLSRKLREGKSEIISSLSLGNIFGYEMISEDEARLTTASAISPVIVLRIDQDRLIQLVDRFPEMVEALQLLYESYQLRLKVRLDWLGSNEAVYLIARRHPMFLAIRLVPIALFTLVTFTPLLLFFLTLSDGLVFLLILLILDVFVIAGWSLWAVSDWANDYSILTNRRVVFLEKVVMLYDSRQESPLTSIMSVSTDTNQIGRMLSYGDVVIHTYAGKIILPYLKSYPEVVKIVEAEWNLSRLRMSKTERVDMERTLRMRLGIETATGKPAEVPQIQPEYAARAGYLGLLWAQIGNLFQIRFEKDGNLTYRTHWFKLLFRIWLPSMSLLGLLLFLGARLAGAFTLISPLAMVTLFFTVGVIVFCWWLYQYLDWRNDYYLVTDEQVLDVYKKPLAREERKAAALRNIQSITFERSGLFGILLNYGTVSIRVGETTLTFDDVANPAEVQRDLFDRIGRREMKEKLADLDTQQKRMGEWIHAYHRVLENNEEEKNPPSSSGGFEVK